MTEAPGANRTIPVRERHRFDERRLTSYLADRLPGIDGALEVRQFEGGQSNPTFLLRAAGRDYVLRKKPPGELLRSAHQVDREYRVMRALAASAVPVPRTWLLCEDESVIGTAFFVMEKVEGRVLRDPLLPAFAPRERAALYDHFTEILAALHAVDPAAAGLADFGRAGNYFARQIARWSKQYQASKTEEIPAMEALATWLADNIPADDQTSLVHGDYRIENAIVHPTEPRVVAVLDWELSTLGHPLADVAYVCLAYHADPGGISGLKGIDHEAAGIPSEAQFLDRYCRLTGRDGMGDWPFYLAFQLFRTAAIAQGVYRRGLDGIAAGGANALAFADICRARAEQAWAMVSGTR